MEKSWEKGDIFLAESDEEDSTCLNVLSNAWRSLSTSCEPPQPIVEATEKRTAQFEYVTYNSRDRLKSLRRVMAENEVGIYIIPSEDEHQSEYTAKKDQRRQYVSGFTGSAGIAVVSLDDKDTFSGSAALSTDGRYFLQAEKQLDSNWELLKQGVDGYKTWQDWALEHSAINQFSKKISVDPRLIRWEVGSSLKTRCDELSVEFLPLMDNLVDLSHGPLDLPAESEIYRLPFKYCGEEIRSKLDRIRDRMKILDATATIVTQLDDIAWTMNLRAEYDIPNVPVFFSYLIIKMDAVTLYVNESCLTDDARVYISSLNGLEIKPYRSFWSDLTVSISANEKISRKVVVPPSVSYGLVSLLPSTWGVMRSPLVESLKSFKNNTEIKGFRSSQLKEGVALARFFSWLNERMEKKLATNEWEAAEKCDQLRKLDPSYRGVSYDTISSSGPNAAIIHYEPSPHEFSTIDPNNIYLLDSGGQYLEGTSDITRTLHFGEPAREHIKMYTLVLKGHLQVAMAGFPKGTNGKALDVLARAPLWRAGVDYRHGTGHGLGSFLSVHEGPVGIGPYNELPLEPGHVVTDEPGYYKENDYGVRIESDLLVVEGQDQHFSFEYLTRVPFCLKLIDTSLLDPTEIEWINKYHSTVRSQVMLLLTRAEDKLARKWLFKETEPL